MSSPVLSSPAPAAALQAGLLGLAEATPAAIAALPDREAERIHFIRVSMKKLRALLDLASPALKKSQVAEADDLARRIKNGFGSQRDEAVRAVLMRRLLGTHAAREAQSALAAAVEDSPAPPAASALAEDAARLAGLIRGLDLNGLSRRGLLDVWAASYRAARRAMRACQGDDPDDDLFHAWRKRVKRLLYQSAALGAPADCLNNGLEPLSSLLGLHHDLAVLCKNIHLCGEAAESAALVKKRKTARLALAKGAGLFALPPGDLMKKKKIR